MKAENMNISLWWDSKEFRGLELGMAIVELGMAITEILTWIESHKW